MVTKLHQVCFVCLKTWVKATRGSADVSVSYGLIKSERCSLLISVLFSQGAVGFDGPKGNQVCLMKPANKMSVLQSVEFGADQVLKMDHASL